MIDATTSRALLDSLIDPVMFVDTHHVIRYMNRAAIEHYSDGESLLGTLLLDCHNDRSCRIIADVLEALEAGEAERLVSEDTTRRIYMRAVRGEDGAVVGYYERYVRRDE